MITPLEFLLYFLFFWALGEFARGLFCGWSGRKLSSGGHLLGLRLFLISGSIYLILAWPQIQERYYLTREKGLALQRAAALKQQQELTQGFQREINLRLQGEELINRLRAEGVIIDISWLGTTLSCSIRPGRRFKKLPQLDQNQIFMVIFRHYHRFYGADRLKILNADTGLQLGLFPLDLGGMGAIAAK
ncbi:MAG: hypothetical protein ACYDHF_06260 [Candidatus Cryosericum sp.]